MCAIQNLLANQLIAASVHLQEPMYELHTICGVNNCVLGPVGTDAKFFRSHVNFLATPKGTPFSTYSNPVLFFAEVSNDNKAEAGTQSFCCLVSVPLPCAGMNLATCLNCFNISSFKLTPERHGHYVYFGYLDVN